MLKKLLAAAAAALLALGGSVALAAPAAAAESGYTYVWWELPEGAAPAANCADAGWTTAACTDQSDYPQVYVAEYTNAYSVPGGFPCGVWLQGDKYLSSEAPGFTEDGLLDYHEDWGSETKTGAIKWSFIYGGDCAPPTPTVEPTAPGFSAADCAYDGSVKPGSYTIPATIPGVSGYTVSLDDGPAAPATVGSHPVDGGTKVTVAAVITDGYAPTGPTSWTTVIVAAEDCGTTVEPAAPGFASADCTAPGTVGMGSYTIPEAETGVDHYEVSLNGGAFGPVGPGTYPVAPGTDVTVTVVLTDGYSPIGDTEWTVEIGQPASCVSDVTAVKATFAAASCTEAGTTTDGSYTVPSLIEGIARYEVSTDGGTTWATATTGTHPVAAGTVVTVRAIALAGYSFQGASSWTETIGSAGDCTPTPPTITPLAAAIDPGTCATTRSFTLSIGESEIDADDAVTFTVNGAPTPAGAYETDNWGELTIVATPGIDPISGEPYEFTGSAGGTLQPDGSVVWVFAAEEPETCVGDYTYLSPLVVAFDPGSCAVGRWFDFDGRDLLGDDLPEGAVAWSVTLDGEPLLDEDGNPVTQPGRYQVGQGMLRVVATPQSVGGIDYRFVLDEASGGQWVDDSHIQVEWFYDYTQPLECDLPTLAITGVNTSQSVLAGLGLVGGGVALLAIRRRKRAA